MDMKICRAEGIEKHVSEFAKNPGRQSLRLDCNSCRSKIQYARVLEQRKARRVYVPQHLRKESDMNNTKLFKQYY